jgi:1-acyl-sn-glycerol-3-phosphate acyltransferase
MSDDMSQELERTLRDTDLDLRDPSLVATVLPLLRLVMKRWFRSEVRDIERVPAEGGVLIVSNHSGGLMPMDVPIIAVAFHDEFGTERPLYTLAHDLLFTGAIETTMRRAGFVEATRANAAAVLERGAVTIVFPGGDYDSFRPTLRQNVIDFAGRTGYVRTALAAGVPIVPVVSIGGQEQQLFLWRGEVLARWLRLEKLMRTDYMPVGLGFPFGLTFAFPPNLPLPTKIVTQVLEPVDIVAEFGPEPDVAAVDEEIRRRMQVALDELASQRRFPVLG